RGPRTRRLTAAHSSTVVALGITLRPHPAGEVFSVMYPLPGNGTRSSYYPSWSQIKG
ncbi:hypothetical protein NW752_003632, partial [Fusarium irregulare]